MSEDQVPPKRRFTQLVDMQLNQTLAQKLVPVIDSVRDLNTRFGIRPYEIRRVRTRWSGGVRGVGQENVYESIPLLPTPRLQDLSTLADIVQPFGTMEGGAVRVTEISGSYEEDFFTGRDALGNPPAADTGLYYEIEFPRLDGRPGLKRRFTLDAAPFYVADDVAWGIVLRRAQDDAPRTGVPRY